MAWTDTQKQIAVRACRAAGLDDGQRKLILRQFSRAFFDEQGRHVDEPTSKSMKLTNADFEQFMALVERWAGGQIRLPGGKAYSRDYWASKADDRAQRPRDLVRRIALVLEQNGLLAPHGQGLSGWIQEQITDGVSADLDSLSPDQLHALINGLRAYARRHGLQDAAWTNSERTPSCPASPSA